MIAHIIGSPLPGRSVPRQNVRECPIWWRFRLPFARSILPRLYRVIVNEIRLSLVYPDIMLSGGLCIGLPFGRTSGAVTISAWPAMLLIATLGAMGFGNCPPIWAIA